MKAISQIWFALLGMMLFLGVAVAPSITSKDINYSLYEINIDINDTSGLYSNKIKLSRENYNT